MSFRLLALNLLLGCTMAVAAPPSTRPAPLDPDAFLRVADVVGEGDLDAIRARGFLRVLVVVNKTHYFVDRGRQYGIAYELLRDFEQQLNQDFPRKRKKYLPIVFIPVHRDEVFQRLQEKRGDLAVANLTVTPERAQMADFSVPFIRDVREILVAAPTALNVSTLNDLAGHTVMVRKSSSYHARLLALNKTFHEQKRAPMQIVEAAEHLEAEDLLEMLNASLIEYSFVDEHIAQAWAPIFQHLRLHPDISLASGQQIAWAIRQGAPVLKQQVDTFLATRNEGTLTGNTLLNRYLRDTQWVHGVTSPQERARFNRTIAYFRKYATRYSFDPLMLAAQGYQESGLDQSRRSPAGAIGVMQIMPATGQALRVGDIRKEEPNIHAGAKYMRQLIDRHFNEPGMDELNRTLFAFAAYNAGPTRVAQLRQEAARRGLDPKQWFHHVETIAALRIGRETTQYVANISKYYIAYRLIAEQSRDGLNSEQR